MKLPLSPGKKSHYPFTWIRDFYLVPHRRSLLLLLTCSWKLISSGSQYKRIPFVGLEFQRTHFTSQETRVLPVFNQLFLEAMETPQWQTHPHLWSILSLKSLRGWPDYINSLRGDTKSLQTACEKLTKAPCILLPSPIVCSLVVDTSTSSLIAPFHPFLFPDYHVGFFRRLANHSPPCLDTLCGCNIAVNVSSNESIYDDISKRWRRWLF